MFNWRPRPSSNCENYESKITGGNCHLGDLSVRTFGKVVIFLDEVRKSLHLVAGLNPTFLNDFEPGSDSPGEILEAVDRLSIKLGGDNVQRHKYILPPKGVSGPIIGGAAVYFDGATTCTSMQRALPLGQSLGRVCSSA